MTVKPNKFGAIKTKVDDIVFASKKEANRYSQLRLLERSGLIRNLELQPKFPIILNGTKVCDYLGDFAFFEGNKRVIEDTKGFRTPVYQLKRKLLLAAFPGIDHREI
jgi:hypothetical protein